MALIVSGYGCSAIAKKVAGMLGFKYEVARVRSFPDGELYVRLPQGLKDEEVAYVVCYGRRPNEALAETVLAVEGLREKGAEKVVLVAPYLPYLRQDAEFTPGEVVSSRVIARLLAKLDVDALITVDPHLHRIRSLSELFPFPAIEVSAMPLLAAFFQKEHGTGVVIAPDEEAERWAKTFADTIGAPYFVFEKQRMGDEIVSVTGAVKRGETAVIVDDIVSTGGTLGEVAQKLLEAGFRDIYACVTHALLVQDAEARIFGSGVKEFISTDSVHNPYARVSVAGVIAEALKGVVNV